MINNYFLDKKNTLISLCNKFHITEIYFFGSSTTDSFCENRSDLDLLIESNHQDSINIIKFRKEVERLYKCKTDIFILSTIKNIEFLKNIELTKQLVYKTTANNGNRCTTP